MRFGRQNAGFWNCEKIDRDLQKLKWHIRMHEKKDVRLDKKMSDIFSPLGVPLCILACKMLLLEGRQNRKRL